MTETTRDKHIRLKIPGESFMAYRYDDLPENQAEINNHLLSDDYRFGDRVEFDKDRNVTRIVRRFFDDEGKRVDGGFIP